MADPAELSIFDSLLSSIAEEMGAALARSALSPNIRERRDFSCAVFDARGRMVGQAAHLPVHLGSMPASVEAVLPLAPFTSGDVIVLNDPYLGGSHLPDVTMVSPVFEDGPSGGLIGYVASRAHQADIGGMSPGSMPAGAAELIQEGLIIPPLRLYRMGILNEEVLALILRNVRTPDERYGDFQAQIAAQRTGESRLRELAVKHGPEVLASRVEDLLDYAERMTAARLARIPPGIYEFEDGLDDDGSSTDFVPIKVQVTIGEGSIEVDFSGSAAERPGSVNAVAAVTCSAVYYTICCLLEGQTPFNAGCFRPVTINLPTASIVSPTPGHAVSAGNVETSQRIVDTVFGALAKALPDIVPAASSGSMNNVIIGGFDGLRGRAFTYYETIGGGAGAGPTGPGLSAVHTHMTNTLNTPVETLESTFPFRIVEYCVRRGSGGRGHHDGGDGIVRQYEFFERASITLVTDRRRVRPWGLRGGEPAKPGRNSLERATGERSELPSKTQFAAGLGDVLTIETPGGGGWGTP